MDGEVVEGHAPDLVVGVVYGGETEAEADGAELLVLGQGHAAEGPAGGGSLPEVDGLDDVELVLAAGDKHIKFAALTLVPEVEHGVGGFGDVDADRRHTHHNLLVDRHPVVEAVVAVLRGEGSGSLRVLGVDERGKVAVVNGAVLLARVVGVLVHYPVAVEEAVGERLDEGHLVGGADGDDVRRLVERVVFAEAGGDLVGHEVLVLEVRVVEGVGCGAALDLGDGGVGVRAEGVEDVVCYGSRVDVSAVLAYLAHGVPGEGGVGVVIADGELDVLGLEGSVGAAPDALVLDLFAGRLA